jgi:protein-S-isoprenylcysteine O-methyltransferase Ste14
VQSIGPSSGTARLALDLLFLAWLAAEVWIRSSRPPQSATPQDGDTRRWLALSYLSVIVGIVLADRGVGPIIVRHNEALFVAGMTLAVLGIALRVWAVRTLGRFFQLVLVVQSDHHVVSNGPYRLIRHPSYAGPLLAFVGVGLALNHWVSLALCFAPPAAALVHRILVEEKMLVDGLGAEYEEYRRKTKRLVPFVW